jgi:membrane protein DedA with SNARE-associated domain
VPELSSLTRRQQKRVHELCYRRHFLFARATARSVASLLAYIFTVASVVLLGNGVLAFLGSPNYWSTIIFALIGGSVGSFVASRIAIPALRPFYHEFIDGKTQD